MQENRLFTRFIVEGEVQIEVQDAIGAVVHVELVDISFKGAGVYSAKMVEVGTPVKFMISGKYFKNPIIGEGKIRYARPWKRGNADIYRLGIEFIDVDSELVRTRLVNLRDILPGSKVYNPPTGHSK
jgi:hypothetical protein